MQFKNIVKGLHSCPVKTLPRDPVKRLCKSTQFFFLQKRHTNDKDFVAREKNKKSLWNRNMHIWMDAYMDFSLGPTVHFQQEFCPLWLEEKVLSSLAGGQSFVLSGWRINLPPVQQNWRPQIKTEIWDRGLLLLLKITVAAAAAAAAGYYSSQQSAAGGGYNSQQFSPNTPSTLHCCCCPK